MGFLDMPSTNPKKWRIWNNNLRQIQKWKSQLIILYSLRDNIGNIPCIFKKNHLDKFVADF